MAVEETTDSLKYQTLVLKVSIHCEGCKKKVKKVLQGIEGVYKVTIDSQRQKVTVTGNVNADTLIRKLLKAGKQAEVWPENKPALRNPSAGGGKKSKKKGSGTSASSDGLDKHETHFEENDASAGENSTPNDSVPNAGNEAKKHSVKNSKVAPSPPEKISGEEGGNPSAASGGKKKKKNGQGNASPSSVSDANRQTSQILQVSDQVPGYPPQPPVYVLSYNSSTPATGHGGGAANPASKQSSYLYSAYQPDCGTCYIPGMASAVGSYDFFSEENANSCSVM
ncbi:hypothetical protein HPP92_016701 [Vanilla planifolia]|uniref:HMA domain-containing protein n=1 Tax=Vanilla planifolia TaxID=51239 RepID=A0A835QKN4_VANPL|nr:hypothetical protein HPP92_016701 [Vanilla planifolia]